MRWRAFLVASVLVLGGCGSDTGNEAAPEIPHRISLGDLATSNDAAIIALRNRVNSDPALLTGYANVGTLSDEYTQALDKQKELYDLYYADVESEANRKATDVADARVCAVDQARSRQCCKWPASSA